MINIDELIDIRVTHRMNKNFTACDQIRDELDSYLVFIFDCPNGKHEIYYLTERYFGKKPAEMTNRKYLEKRIQSEIRAEKLFNAWLFTTKK